MLNKDFNSLKFSGADRQLLEDNYSGLMHAFNENTELYSREVSYVCASFEEAAFKSGLASSPLILEFLQKGDTLCGTRLSSKGTILYYIHVTEENKIEYSFMSFCDLDIFEWHGAQMDGECYELASTFLKTQAPYSEFFKGDPGAEYWLHLFSLVVGEAMFKKYAKVEIVESKARTKIHAQGCKYLNETDLDIEYLDSKWFTTLVNSKGFKVGGHFRLQPKKKEGEWTKELIWINDFEKKGYNRKAGILK